MEGPDCIRILGFGMNLNTEILICVFQKNESGICVAVVWQKNREQRVGDA